MVRRIALGICNRVADLLGHVSAGLESVVLVDADQARGQERVQEAGSPWAPKLLNSTPRLWWRSVSSSQTPTTRAPMSSAVKPKMAN